MPRRRKGSGHQNPARRPLFLRGRRCSPRRLWRRSGRGRRRLAPPPGGTAVARRPEPAAPSLTWPRADSAPRRRPGSPPPPRPWPAAPPLVARPGPVGSRRFLPLRLPRGRRLSVRGRRSVSPPLRAAARPAWHAGRPGRLPALSASLVRRWTGPPSLLQSPAAFLRRRRRPRTRRAAPSLLTGRLSSPHQRPP